MSDRTFCLSQTPSFYSIRRGGPWGERIGWANCVTHSMDNSGVDEWSVTLKSADPDEFADQFVVRGGAIDIEKECDRRRGVAT